MGHTMWQTESGGVLACELGRLRLAVELSSWRVRHTVHRREDSAKDPSPTLIAIGSGDNIQAATQAAESVAAGQASTAETGHRGSVRDHAA